MNIKNGYLDLFTNHSGETKSVHFQNWTYVSSERRMFQSHGKNSDLFYLQLADIKTRIGIITGVEVRAEAFITEYFYNNTQRGFCETKIINNSYSFKFVGNPPFVFKPGMPFYGALSLRYSDQMALSEEVLSGSELELRYYAKLQNGSTVELPFVHIPKKGSDPYKNLHESKINSTILLQKGFTNTEDANNEELKEIPLYNAHVKEISFEDFRKRGIFQFKIDVPEYATVLNLSAKYTNVEEDRELFTNAYAYAAFEPKNRYISVHTGSQNVAIGHFVVFHVRSNFPITYFDWILISKNIILNTGRIKFLESEATVTTFSLAVSPEMAPGFHIMVYTISQPDTQLLTDITYSPVQSFNRHKIEFKLSHRKDHTMETVEATCRGDPGAIYLASSLRSYLFPGQGKHHITKVSLMENLHNLEKTTRHIHKVFFSDREGIKADQIIYYPSMDYGLDSSRSLGLHHMLVLTDFAEVPVIPSVKSCDKDKNQFPCLLNGCYTKKQICDGHNDCDDGFDESNCSDEAIELKESVQKYRLSRWDRNTEFYDIGDGDWGWFELNIDEDREQFPNLKVPLITDSWFFHVMSISERYGIGIFEEPISYDSIRPVHFVCEGPTEVRRGESVGIRCVILNRSQNDMEAIVILNDSPDYEFIHVEEFGYVVSYAPRTSIGNHHHLVFVRGEDELEVLLPVKPKIEQGELTVSVTLSTQVMTSSQDMTIVITPEGCGMHRHTSTLIDLKSRAFEVEYLDIVVDETPLIPYELSRRYIFGSPYGMVSISGDVVGPTFMNDEPVSLESMFPEFSGKFGKGSEYHAFNLAANTWQLHYYRLTNQFRENWDLVKTVFEQMNIEYAAVMRRFTTQGWVSVWDSSGPSVWLTSWCIRIFQSASFQDWEDFFYVDSQVISSAIMWLINYQHACTYLERNLARITDPYDMAITAYALALSKSSESDIAYGKLLQMKREEAGMAYWSPTKIAYNSVRYEFNRPFLQPKDNQINDAIAVEATAYALLTLFLVKGGGMTILQDQIVNWLNSMRMAYGGFLSTVDTIVALEALVRYSYNSRIKDITDINVEVDILDSNIKMNIPISSDGISQLRQISIPNVWGHVNIVASGSGQALAQMDVVFGVDHENFIDSPPEECFTLTVSESFRGRNKSEIDVNTCFSWTCTEESQASGMAMLIIDMPSGYIMQQVGSRSNYYFLNVTLLSANELYIFNIHKNHVTQ